MPVQSAMPAAVPSAGNAAACPGPGEAEEAARWETFTQVLALNAAWLRRSWVSACTDEQLLAWAGCRHAGGAWVLPSPDTVRRLFDRLSAQDLADAIGVWLLSRIELAPVCFPVAGPVLLTAIAIDGKAVRGAIPAGGQIPFLLAAATHASAATRKAATVVAERLIGARPYTLVRPRSHPHLAQDGTMSMIEGSQQVITGFPAAGRAP